MNSEGKAMFKWVMTFTGVVGGVIWLLAFLDFLLGNSWENTHGPIIGIPLGLALCGTVFYFYCRSAHPTNKEHHD